MCWTRCWHGAASSAARARGSGFLAPPVFSAVYLAPSVLAAQIGGLTLVFGMTLFAGVIEVLVAVALDRIRVVITPVLSGLTVFVVGLQLGVVGIGETLDVQHETLPTFPLHLIVTTLTLMVCIALSIWGRGTLKLLCSSLGLVAGMASAWAIGLIDPSRLAAIGSVPWIAVPRPFLQVGFDIGSYLPFSLLALPLHCAQSASSRPASELTTLPGNGRTGLTSAKGFWPTDSPTCSVAASGCRA